MMSSSRVLMTVAVGIAACWFFIGCASTDWNRATGLSTREAYEEFMGKHPDDPRSKEAELALKRLDEFDHARAVDKAAEYTEFIQSYTTNNVVGKMIAHRLKELQNPITVPAALQDEAAQAFSSGKKYYIWVDPESTNTVDLAGDSNGVFWMNIQFYAIGAPGSDCPVFRPAFSFVRLNDAKATIEGTWGWMKTLTTQRMCVGFAGPACATDANALWFTAMPVRLTGRGTVPVVLFDYNDTVQKEKDEGITPISNIIMVPVDCSKGD